MNEEDYEVDMTLFKLNNKKNEKINKAPVVSNVKKGKNKKDSDEESEMLNESGSETSNSKGRKKSTRKPIKKPAIVSSSDDESNFGQGSPKSEDSDVFVEDVDSGSAFEGSAASVDSEDSVDEDIDPKIAALDEEVDEEDRFIPDDDVILRPFERRRRESDDEDDGLMEPVPEVIIRAQEAPIEVIPVIELVDLDKKIVARAKKNEFEPLSGAILKNISITNPSCGWMNHYIQNEGSLPSVHELVTAQQSKSEDASNDIKMENSNMESKSIVTQEFNGQSIHPAILSSSLNNSNLDTFTWSKEIESLKPTWFNFNLVHIYEMRVFPDFFLDDEYYAEGENIHREQRHPLKTPEFYQNVRNVIVCAYQKDLVQYMSCLACLPFVSNISQKMFNQSYELSFEDLIRLHSFFEQSGLINNAVLNLDNFREIGTFVEIKESIKTRAALLEDKTLEKRENSRGRNLKQWEVFVEDLTADSSVTKKLTEVVSLEEALNVPSKIQGVEYQCFVCSQFAYNLRYRGIYPKTLVLCPDCYKEGIFPSCMKGSEFVRVEGPVGITDPYKRPDWNDDELLALLEGIEIHDENWRKISDYVGTRTVEECIVKFLKIPIGETEKWDSLLRKRPKLEAVNFTINNELEKEENLQNNIALSDNTLTLAAEAGLEKEFKELEYNGDNNESKVTSMDIENLKKLPGLEELYEIFAASENPLTSFLSIISTCLNPAFASSSSRVVLNFITSYFAEESNLSFKGEKYDLRKLNKDLLTYAILGALRESIICCEGEEERIKKYMKLCLELQLQLVEERISCLEKINETLN
ncbi:hypothetical protein HDU92_000119 [Lobulomyces angularis]|nr:hypothetical protein HDU92_000119 [Lobulomyces angularis]